MKKVLFMLSALLFWVVVSCEPDSIRLQKGNIKLGYTLKTRGGRTHDLLTPVAVLLSIEDHQGNLIADGKKFPLYTFGDSYVTESFEINAGSYQLTQFAVLDASNTIVYACPAKNSALASLVDNPIPFDFVVSPDANTNIVPQVLPVQKVDKPENFGYASFEFEVVSRSNIDYVIFDDLYQEKTKYTFSFSDLQVKSVTHFVEFPPYSSGIWDKGFTEIRTFDSEGKILELSFGPLMKRKYKYTNGRLIGSIKESDLSTSGSQATLYDDRQIIEEYAGSHPSKILIERGNGSIQRRVFLEFDNNQNLISKTVVDVKTGQILVKCNYKFDNKPNPFRRLFEANHVVWPFDEINFLFDDITFYYSKNNPVSVDVFDSQQGDRRVEYKITYDSKQRPVVIDTGVSCGNAGNICYSQLAITIAYKD